LHVPRRFNVFTNIMIPARFCALLAFVFQVAAAQSRPVEGVVVNRVTGAGIAGANVTFYTPQAVRYQATTDASGAFKIAKMDLGEYRAVVEKDGFAVFPAEPFRVEADASTSPVRVRYQMQFAAKQDSKLAGRVLDSQGKPLASAAVDLIRGPEYRFRTLTDAEGRFTFDQLAPGAYKLRAAPANAGAGVATYFPSSIDESGAERIMIRGTAEIDGFRLQTAPVVHVRGVAVDENGKPAPRAIVRLVPIIPRPAHVVASVDSFFIVAGESLGPGPDEARVVAGDDGSFEFPAVRAGEWRIVANLDEASGVMPVIVQQSNVENIRVRLESPQTINGTARWSIFFVSGRLAFGTKVAQGAVFPIWIESLDGQPSALRLAMIQPGGAFALDRLPQGRYRMQSLLPLVDGRLFPGAAASPGRTPNSSPTDLTYTVHLSEGGQVLLNDDHPIDPAGLSVKTAMYATVRGTIEHAEEFAGVLAIVLLPVGDNTTNYGVLALSQPDGTFVASGLASGRYYAAAFPSLDLAGLRDPELLRRVIALDNKVLVDVGSTSELKLTAIAWPE
jgi:protocatechuate 3,4-dioxygenase beta subunit